MRIPLTNIHIERRSGLANPSQWLREVLGAQPAKSGVTVTPQTAMQVSAVFACVRVLAETVASLPLPIYRRLEGGGKDKASDHYLYQILHNQPNSEMTSFEFRETLMGHLALWGNAYAEIERNGAGRVIALWPLRPDQMQVKREQGLITYTYNLSNGAQVKLRPEQILHIRGLSSDGIMGYSPIQMARESIGLAIATEEYGSLFFSNGAHPGGIIEYPKALRDEALQNFKQSVKEAYGGLGNTHRLMILEQDLKYHAVGIPGKDSQFLETRQFQTNEIARIFRVPPHLIGDLSKATFSNIEHQSLEFVVHTIRPWLLRWEQAISKALFLPGERQTYFAEFVVDGLLRGDTKSRYDAYAVARQNGWMSADDIRALENLNPLPNGQGQVYLVNGNMMPITGVGNPAGDRNQSVVAELRSGLAVRSGVMDSAIPAFADAVRRILKREEADIMRQARKAFNDAGMGLELFNGFVEDFYMKHSEYIDKIMAPVMTTYAGTVRAAAAAETGGALDGVAGFDDDFLINYLAAYISRHIGLSKTNIRDALQANIVTPIESLQEVFADWQNERVGYIAQEETIRLGSAVSLLTWQAVGVRRVRWVTSGGENCDICRNLDGKIVSIGTPFDAAHKHPPLHKGCDCRLMPEGG